MRSIFMLMISMAAFGQDFVFPEMKRIPEPGQFVIPKAFAPNKVWVVAPRPQGPFFVNQAEPAVCSVPLTPVRPPSEYASIVLIPQAAGMAAMPKIEVPAPACTK